MSMKGMHKYFAEEGGFGHYLTLSYWSPEVEAKWSFNDDGNGDLQITYSRKASPAIPSDTDDLFDLFLDATDARVIGELLLAFADAKRRASE